MGRCTWSTTAWETMCRSWWFSERWEPPATRKSSSSWVWWMYLIHLLHIAFYFVVDIVIVYYHYYICCILQYCIFSFPANFIYKDDDTWLRACLVYIYIYVYVYVYSLGTTAFRSDTTGLSYAYMYIHHSRRTRCTLAKHIECGTILILSAPLRTAFYMRFCVLQVGSEPEIMNAFMASLEEAQSVGVYTQKQALLYIGTKMRAPPKAGARAMRQQSSWVSSQSISQPASPDIHSTPWLIVTFAHRLESFSFSFALYSWKIYIYIWFSVPPAIHPVPSFITFPVTFERVRDVALGRPPSIHPSIPPIDVVPRRFDSEKNLVTGQSTG